MPVFTTGVFPAGGEVGSGGAILQIVYSEKPDTWTANTGSSYVDIIGMTVSITMQQSGNKVIIWPSLTMGAATSHRHGFRILRGSTELHVAQGFGSRRAATSGQGNPPNSVMTYQYCTPFLDTPGAGTHTYKLQAVGEGSSTNIYVNRTENDGNNIDKFRFTSSMMAMEVSS